MSDEKNMGHALSDDELDTVTGGQVIVNNQPYKEVRPTDSCAVYMCKECGRSWHRHTLECPLHSSVMDTCQSCYYFRVYDRMTYYCAN